MANSQPKVTLVATIKDEGAYIGEWIAHHRSIGVTDFLLFQNDSKDNTSEICELFASLGLIKFDENPCRKQQWQNKAYRRASRREAYRQADWVLTLDADEFLVVNTAEGTIASIVEPLADNVGYIEFERITFGCDQKVEICEGFVTEEFLACHDPNAKRRHPVGFKSLHRPSFFKRSGIHRPKVELKEGAVILNGSGKDTSTLGFKHTNFGDPDGGLLGTVNHYPIRDVQNYLLKGKRGSASHVDRQLGLHYFNFNNGRGFTDPRISRHYEGMKAEYEAMNSKSDGEVELARKKGLQQRKSMFEALIEDEDQRALYEEYIAAMTS